MLLRTLGRRIVNAPLLSLDHSLFAGDHPIFAILPPTVEFGGKHRGAALVEGSVVWPEFGVATYHGRLVERTIVDARLLERYRQRGRFRRLPIVPVPGVIACLNVGSSHKGFFHQWFEALPRAWVLSGLDWNFELPTIVVTQHLSEGFSDVLEALLPPKTSVRRVPRAVRLRPTGGYLHLDVPFRNQIPDIASPPTKCLPDLYITDFRRITSDLFRLPREAQDVGIYISRSTAHARRLTNDDDIIRYVEGRGFRTIRPELLPISEQAHAFASASCVIAQHGAALSNLLYCHPGTLVIEIFNGPTPNDDLYRSIAEQLHLDYRSIQLDGLGKDADGTLPVRLLAAQLRTAP